MAGSRPQLRPLTGIRFVAALLVALFHRAKPLVVDAPAPVRNIVGSGYVGVSLFFVLSGFIMAYTYLDDGPRSTIVAREYWAARLARIYPVYLLGVFLALPKFALHAFRDTATGLQGLTFFAGVTGSAVLLVQSWVPRYACELNCPGWSLSTEAFFYLLFPVIAVLCRRRTPSELLWWCAACWAGAVAIPLAYMAAVPGAMDAVARDAGIGLNLVKYAPAARLPEFLLGVATGRLFLLRRHTWPALARRSGLLVAATTLVILTVLAARDHIPKLVLHNGLLALPFAILILGLAMGGGAIGAVLGTSTMVLLGEASYALYILHQPLYYWMSTIANALGYSSARPWALVSLWLLTSTLVAITVLRRLELPMRARLRALMVRPDSSPRGLAA